MLDCSNFPITPEIVKETIERDFSVDDIQTGAKKIERGEIFAEWSH